MVSKTIIVAAVAVGMTRMITAGAQEMVRQEPVGWQTAQATDFPNTINGRRLEDAPVPGITEGRVAPADRIGSEPSATQMSGPVGSTPFSGAPQSDRATDSSQARIEPDANDSNVTPRLTK